MPFVLDYDRHGNVIGGHFVEELPARNVRFEPKHLKADMGRGQGFNLQNDEWSNGHFPYAQPISNDPQPNPLLIDASSGLFQVPAALSPPHAQLENQLQMKETSHHQNNIQANHDKGQAIQDWQVNGRSRQDVSDPVALPTYSLADAASLPWQSLLWQSSEISPAQTGLRSGQNFFNQPTCDPRQLLLSANVDDTIHSSRASTPRSGASTAPGYIMATPNADVDRPRRPRRSNRAKSSAKIVTEAQSFLSRLGDHLQDEPAAFSSFVAYCSAYNRKEIDEMTLYVNFYPILSRTDSLLQFWQELQGFMPPQWRDVDLSWLRRAIATESEKKRSTEIGKETDAGLQNEVPKKKIPINGFRASQGWYSSSSGSDLPKLPVESRQPHSASFVREDAVSSSSTSMSAPARAKRGKKNTRGLVKLNLKGSKAASSSAAPLDTPGSVTQLASSKPLPGSARPTTDANPTPSIKGKTRYSSLHSSAVTHFGPVFATRRAVLSRPNRPYIHAACGQGFAHPQDVRSHARNQKCAVEGKEWDDHASCKADYTSLKYARVQDGFVVLNQDSWDRLEKAVAAGNGFHALNAAEGDGEEDHAEGEDEDVEMEDQ